MVTPIWPILVAALGGSLLSGTLLILSSHIQSKRDDNREQRRFARQTQLEALDRVKLLIDEGVGFAAHLQIWASTNMPPAESGFRINEIHKYTAATNGALIAASAIGAEGLRAEVLVNASLANEIGILITRRDPAVGAKHTELLESLAHIERQHTDLKLAQIALNQAPGKPWWKLLG